MINEKDLLKYCEENDVFVNEPQKGPMYITSDARFVWVRRIGDIHRELFYFYEQDNDIDSDWDEDMIDFEYDYNWIRLNDGMTHTEPACYFVCFSRPNEDQKEKLIDWFYYLLSINKESVEFTDTKRGKSFILSLKKNLPEDLWASLVGYYMTGILIEGKEKNTLHEDTRNQLITKSRNVDTYKHNIRGKNRFERKKFSHVANQVKSYNTIDMNKFFKQDLLEVVIPVTGETSDYSVTLQFDGVATEIAKNIKNNQNKFEYRTVIQAITKVFNVSNIRVKCTCADFKYRYAHNLIINNNSVDDSAHDPGPGHTGMTAAMKGQGCKHILLVLANQDWIMKVASCIKNYITYMDENKHDLFMKAIFPKMYGITEDQIKDNNLVADDAALDSKSAIIDEINAWAKNRGKIQKGSNKNPVAQAKRDKEAKEKEETKPGAKPAEKPEQTEKDEK